MHFFGRDYSTISEFFMFFKLFVVHYDSNLLHIHTCFKHFFSTMLEPHQYHKNNTALFDPCRDKMFHMCMCYHIKFNQRPPLNNTYTHIVMDCLSFTPPASIPGIILFYINTYRLVFRVIFPNIHRQVIYNEHRYQQYHHFSFLIFVKSKELDSDNQT